MIYETILHTALYQRAIKLELFNACKSNIILICIREKRRQVYGIVRTSEASFYPNVAGHPRVWDIFHSEQALQHHSRFNGGLGLLVAVCTVVYR